MTVMEMLWLLILLLFEATWCSRAAGDLVTEYTKRLCKNEPTCSLVNHPSIPRVFRSLEKRNCLCDADCREYKDCCIDSMFYRIHDQLPPFLYYCSANKKVYMKTRCLAEWTDVNMVTKCEKSILPLEDDLSVITPLTNLVTGVTYGNVYCAVCNNAFTVRTADDFYTWTLSVRCGELPFEPRPVPVPVPAPAPASALALAPTPPLGQQPAAGWRTPLLVQVPRLVLLDRDFEMTLRQLYRSQPPANGYYLLLLLLYYIHPATASVRAVRRVQPPIRVVGDSGGDWRRRRRAVAANLTDVDFEKYADEWEAIALNASYDADAGLWLSRDRDRHRDRTFVCEYESRLPASDDVPLRRCVPNVIAECSRFENALLVHQCRLRTAVVYDERGLAYRNTECALCNGVREHQLFVCPYDDDDDDDDDENGARDPLVDHSL